MATVIETPQELARFALEDQPVMHFEILRRIAETASGMRYVDTYFEIVSINDGENYEIRVHSPDPPPDNGNFVLKCTAWQRPKVPTVAAGSITSSGANPVVVDLLNIPVPEEETQGWTGAKQANAAPPTSFGADAVFWSAAAVEKFLVPYYASTYGSLAPRIVAQLMNIFVPPDSPETQGNGMMDMANVPRADIPANATLVPTLGTPTDADVIVNPPDYDQPFAVVHLPNSEYTPEPGSSPIFTLHQSGAVRRFRVDVR